MKIEEAQRLHDEYPTDLKYSFSALIEDEKDFLMELWGDIRVKAFDGAHRFKFDKKEEAVALLEKMATEIEASGGDASNFRDLAVWVNEQESDSAKERKPDLHKGDFRAVVNGKIYDTAKATPLEENLENGDDAFRFVYKRLYETKKGNRFVVIHAGAKTPYAKRLSRNKFAPNLFIEPL